MTQRVAPFLVIGLLVLAWAFVVPRRGLVDSRAGERAQGRLDGSAWGHRYRYEVAGYGVPGGPIRFGTFEQEAWEEDARGVRRTLPDSEELAQAVRESGRPIRVGWHVDGGAAAGAVVVAAVVFGLTSAWWLALRTPTALTRWPSLVRVPLLALWPAAVGTGIAIDVWERLGEPETAAIITGPRASIAGTMAAVSVGLVLLLTPRPRDVG